MDTARIPHSMSEPAAIAPGALRRRLGRADTPLLLDVRKPPAFAQAMHRLVGALRCAPDDVAAFAASQPPREVVVYCAYGHGVGCEAARVLAAAGWDARHLAGGIEGGEDGVDAPELVAQWRSAQLPRVRQRPDLGVTGEQPSRWVTRARPKIDRLACPWLVRRFIDPRAEFFYVPATEVEREAARLGAIPFDIEGAAIGHVWERCSFDALLQAFELHTPALDAMAAIVRGADTARLGIAPQAAGLLALSLGLSRLWQDDQALLQAALPLYDALHAWADGARGETHNWPAHVTQAATA